MTPGQQRAIRELGRLHAADPNGFEVLDAPRRLEDGRAIATISLRIGLLERREGGLDLREREQFLLTIPADFPFDYPTLSVTHTRFAGFPHVIWAKTLCLYQSKIEWNPADGLFGFFDRLSTWLGRAARNDMDPVEGPLEPPHHVTDFSELPVVIRSDAPVEAGNRWIGWAEIQKLPNRIEVIGWREFGDELPADLRTALTVILSEPLLMEFPRKGGDLFGELLKQGVDRNLLLRFLALASLVTPDDDSAHPVIGLPMRRSRAGAPRLHIAVWVTAPEYAKSVRLTIPQADDPESIKVLRQDLADAIYSLFEVTTIKWCQVLEDRDEIVVRRDADTPISWFREKRVLILGCGALGSWAAEIIGRAKCGTIHLVDSSMVKPGLLARQNFTLEDIGASKAFALARRLRAICTGTEVQDFAREAHTFILADLDRVSRYDLVIDCTASSIFQMKIERDWSTVRSSIQRFASFVIDARAQRLLAVSLGRQPNDGPWSAYLRLKYKLCAEEHRPDLVSAFYAREATDALFQPEPGCSDPTFSGSTADVSRLAATALNEIVSDLPTDGNAKGIAFIAPASHNRAGSFDSVDFVPVHEAKAGGYRVLISRKVFNQARAFVRQNNRWRSREHETGGLLWGYWDDACGLIVVFDASGPPPDSRHDPGHFICGVAGTETEHQYRSTHSLGVCGFVGFWHTHPNLPPEQSPEDIRGMAGLVARVGQNQRRALMLIYGRTGGQASAGVYLYEAQSAASNFELLHVGLAHIPLGIPVV